MCGAEEEGGACVGVCAGECACVRVCVCAVIHCSILFIYKNTNLSHSVKFVHNNHGHFYITANWPCMKKYNLFLQALLVLS